MKLSEITQAFSQVLSISLSEQTSLPFIKHNLAARPLVKTGEMFQALTIGGSICQTGLMRMNNVIHPYNHKTEQQPSFTREREFLDYVISKLDKNISVLGLNFAYPLTPQLRGGVIDGILVSGSKENSFDGLVGKPVGETIEQYVKEKTGRKIKVSVANDTICLLLSGLTRYPWNKLAAGVVGTGTNFAIFLDEHTAVNLESAQFDKFEMSETGKIVDQESVQPGKALFEKEVSGAYLFQHFNLIAEQKGWTTRIQNTESLSEIARSGKAAKQHTAQELMKRSAELIACQVAGILEFCKRDLLFIMEGSLFWKGFQYRETVEETVKELSKQYRAEFIEIENSALLGAAKLVV